LIDAIGDQTEWFIMVRVSMFNMFTVNLCRMFIGGGVIAAAVCYQVC
jgi:hypothetical protein